MKELVSIGIPTYNRPQGLQRTLQHFTAQTYTNLEIIVSDNCSDNPEVNNIIQEFAAKDTRIKSFRQEDNIGMFENFRFVLKQATGKYFMWSSDDDEFYSDYIEKCLLEFENNPDIILASPICKVMANGEEVMKYKPDFDTIGLEKLDRVKKIAFYVKKSHSALYGLIKTDLLKKVKLHTIIDPDGLLLIELSRLGEFKKIHEVLMISHSDYDENGTESLTNQKKKFIERYNMKPARLLLKHENKTLFFYFLFQTFKWKDINVLENFRVSSIIYRSFFGYNTCKVFSVFRTLNFFLKKKSVLPVVTITPQANLDIASLKSFSENFNKVILSISSNNYGDYDVKRKPFDNLLEIVNKAEITNAEIHTGAWTTFYAQQQHTLDYVRNKSFKSTHLFYISDLENVVKLNFKEISKIAKSKRTFNRAVYFNKYNLLFPNRKYVNFKADNALTIGSGTIQN